MPQQQIYYTHYNGDRPFKVVINGKSLKVYIETKFNPDETHEYSNTPIYKIDNFRKIFIGDDRQDAFTKDVCEISEALGNTILVNIDNKTYAYIGNEIYSFEPEYEITKYNSDIGLNDVPYPYAEDSKNIYIMLDNNYFEKYLFTVYSFYYGHKPYAKSMKAICKIHGHPNIVLG